MHLKSPLAKLLMATAAFVAFVHPNALAAQSRNSDKKATFDIRRFSPTAPGTFETFYVTETQSLKQALDGGSVKEDTRLLVTETATGKLALLTDQMAYHHIAEGNAGGKDWTRGFHVVRSFLRVTALAVTLALFGVVSDGVVTARDTGDTGSYLGCENYP